MLDTLPDERSGDPVTLPAHYHLVPDVRGALLHALEHSALHQGHIQFTRQLPGYLPPTED